MAASRAPGPTESGRDRVQAHDYPASCRWQHPGDALGHGRAGHDEHIGPPGGRRTTAACRRTEVRSAGSRLAASASVRKCRALRSSAQRCPPGLTKLTLLSATRRPLTCCGFPPEQPGWADVLRRLR